MPKEPPPTTDGKLSEVARHVVVPDGLVSTGWPAVRDKSLELGIKFDSWQDGVGRIILSKRGDGLYATSVGGVVISIPRQVGKTFLIGALVFALCLLYPGLTVIWTAHRLRTAAETFSSMQAMARRRRIAPHVEKVVLGSGDEEIQFRNRSRILFGARERGFGRGFSMVDVLVFDEAQILTENAIDDMVPATNQAANPLLLFTGTPPKPTDPGEVFSAKRAKALAGESVDMAYIEFSADEAADPNDRKQWKKANPSYPRRTPTQAILRMRENLTVESFMREGMGVWAASAEPAVIPLSVWNAPPLLDKTTDWEPVGRPVFSVDVTGDRSQTTIGVACWRPDRFPQVEIAATGPDTGWVAPWLAERRKKYGRGLKVMFNAGGPAGSLADGMEAARVEFVPVTAREMGRACGLFYDETMAGTLRHPDDQRLAASVGSASTRSMSDAWVWDLRKPGPVSPVLAVTLARFGLPRFRQTKPKVVSLADALAAHDAREGNR